MELSEVSKGVVSTSLLDFWLDKEEYLRQRLLNTYTIERCGNNGAIFQDSTIDAINNIASNPDLCIADRMLETISVFFWKDAA